MVGSTGQWMGQVAGRARERVRTWGQWLAGAAGVLALAGALVPLAAQAQQPVTAFGPQAAELQPVGNRVAQKTDTYTWARKQGKQATYELHISNTSPTQTGNRTSEVEVWHNGAKVLGTRDLFRPNGQPIAEVRKPLDTRKNNQLEIRMVGRAAVRLGMQVVALPPPPPRIANLTPNRLEINHGASGVLTAQLQPVPTRAGTLTVATNRDDTADAPRVLRYAAGQARVAIPVYGEGVGRAQITAQLNGSTDSARVDVNPAPARVVGLTPLHSELSRGTTALYTVTVRPKRTQQAHQVELQSTHPQRLSVPARVTIAQGAGSASFVATAGSLGHVNITARLADRGIQSAASAHVQIVAPKPPTLASLLPAISSVTQGGTAQLSLSLSAAQTRSTTVALQTLNPAVLQAPAQVVVAPGQTQANIVIRGLQPGNSALVAMLNASTAQAAVNVSALPASLASLQPATATLEVGAQAPLRVVLAAPAATATTVALAVQPDGVVQLGASAQIAPGQQEVQIPVTALAAGQAQVSATLNGVTRTASYIVTPQPPRVAGIDPQALALQTGANARLTVRLTSAPAEAVEVDLQTTAPGVLEVPDTLSIPAGQDRQEFSVLGLTAGQARVSASLNGTSQGTTVTVAQPPPHVLRIEPPTQNLPHGKLGQITVVLNRAPQADTVVALGNSNPGALGLPAQITIPAGALSAPVPLVAQQQGTAQITAGLNGAAVNSTVNVVAPELVSISLTPAAPQLSPGQVVQLQAIGTYSDASTRDITNDAATQWQVTPDDTEGDEDTDTVAEITADGKLMGLEPGSAIVRATQAVSPTWANPTPAPVTGQGTVTVGAPQALALATTHAQLQVGQTATVSISAPYPAAARAITVTLSASAGLQAPAQALIGPGLTSVNITVQATTAGAAVLQATAQPYTPGQLTLVITEPAPSSVRIDAITPTSAAPGANVTIIGSGYASPASANTVVFHGNVPAIVQSGSATQLTVKVPDTAQSGPITVSNNLGSAQSAHFTVLREQDYALQASPAYLRVMQGSNAIAALSLATNGTRAYQGLAKLTVTGLPAAVQARFEPATLSAYQSGKLILTADATAALGTAQITLRAEATLDGLPWVRETRIGIETISNLGVTGVKGRFVTPAGAGIAGVIVRQDTTTNQVVSDAAGNFLMTGLATGTTTLRFDATPANSLYPIWPYNVTLDAGQLLTVADWVINPPPADEQFKTINNATQDQAITDERYPGFAVTLPAGVRIVGYDGVHKTRIAVQRIAPDQLPVGAPPFPMKEAYQLYFGTPMGGIPSAPIPVTLPNVAEKEPGEKAEIWWFDGSPMGGTGEWKMAGLGTVSPDGRTIASDPGVGLPRFCGVCGLVSVRCPPPPNPPPPPPPPAPPPPAPPAPPPPNDPPPPPPPDAPPSDPPPNDPPPDAPPSDPPADDPSGDPPTPGDPPNPDGPPTPPTPLPPDTPPVESEPSTETDTDNKESGEDPDSSPPCSSPNPVMYTTGQEMPTSGGLRCGGLTPIDTGLTYNPVDSFNGRAGTFGSFGLGWTSDYDIAFLPFAGPQKRLLMPGGRQINFIDDGRGTYRTTEDHRFEGGTFKADGATDWVLTHKSGAKWRFKPFAGITGAIRGGAPTFVTEMTDPAGNTLSITRQSNGRLTALGNQHRNVSYSYGANGFVSQVSDGMGRTMRYTYNANSSLETITDADNKVTRYTYRTQPGVTFVNNQPATPEDAIRGVTCAVEAAQPLGQQIETITYPGRAQPTVNSYGSSGRVLRQTASDGQVLDFQYKVIGACVANITNPTARCQGPACPGTDSHEAQQAGWRFFGGTVMGITVKRADGSSTAQVFNATGRPTSYTDERGQTTRYKYDGQNRLVQTTDSLGRVWRKIYDERGNIAQTLDPAGRRVEYTYDIKWNKVTSITKYQTDGVRRVWQYQYDATHGQIIRQTNPSGKTVHYSYTPRGELAGEGYNTTTPYRRHTYNAAGDKTATTDASGAQTAVNHDAVGRPVQVTNALGYSSQVQYNPRDQVIKTTNALGHDVLTSYDDAGRVTQITNEAGVVIERYTYDARGRLEATTDALGKATRISYDELNRPVEVTDRKGQTTRYAYDIAGQLAQITHADGSVQSYSYDATGRLSEMSEPASRWAYRYDRLNRVIQTSHTTAAGKVDIHYQYSRFDNVKARWIRRDGVTIESSSYLYDNLNRLVGMRVKPVGHAGVPDQITTWRYNSAGKVIRRILPNGIRQLYAYDTAGRLAQIKYQRSDNSLIEQIDYTYDAIGQRTSKTLLNSTGGNETPMSASYDAANRMNSVTLNMAGTSKTYSLSYDDNGNLLKKENTQDPNDKTQYSWDTRNRLTGLNQPNLQASFSYDSGGRRIAKTITANGQANTTQYIYEGAQAIGEVRNGLLDASLISAGGLDEVMARVLSTASSGNATPQVKTMLTDALGSVIAQARADQTVENGYAYSPYGETTKVGPEQGSAPNELQYTGRENDGTGLYFNRARYWDWILKRWISQDPIGLAGGLNVYAYPANPISLADPTGLCPMCVPIVLACRSLLPLALGWGIVNSSSNSHNPDQRALGDIVDEQTNGGRKPLSSGDADTILDWARELGMGGKDHRDTDHWVGGPHIHVPGTGVRHIPAKQK